MADEIEIKIKSLLEKATFSFVGTVLHLGAATMTNLDVDDHTAVVRIDYVLHAPDIFKRIRAHWITLQLRKDADLPAVQRKIAFFAEGRVFGETIAMAEIGRLPVQSVLPYIKRAEKAGLIAGAFADLLREMQQEKLRKYMRAAAAVVLGTVVALEAVPRDKDSPHPGEHDPGWWVATINVRHVGHGDAGLGAGGRGLVRVLFASSPDARWRRAPKPRASQGGLWILHKTQGALQNFARFQMLNLQDYQLTQQLDLLREPGDPAHA